MTPAAFHVEAADYATRQALLHGVREAVFVGEQQVPAALESDDLDPLSHHVLALDADGHAIGTGRLTPQRRIGRMAVLPGWRGHGVGEALLQALVAEAARRGWDEVTLHAQLHARDFYARNGFLPEGAPFTEAGIVHQTMRRRMGGAMRVQDAAQAEAALAAVIHRARRRLLLGCRGGDTALLAQPAVLQALRRFATRRHDKQALVLLHDAEPAAMPAALQALLQRLPSVFALRQPVDPGDPSLAPASASNDNGDCYFRPMGDRFEGELCLDMPATARQQDALFQRAWDAAALCEGLRTLGM